MPPSNVVAVAVGAVLVGSAIAWRWLSNWRATRLLRAALVDPHPETRVAALRAIGSAGITPYAKLLVERCRAESDEQVLDELAALISRHLWEPTDSEALATLRLWAERRLIHAEQGASTASDRSVPAATALPAPAEEPAAPRPQALEPTAGAPTTSATPATASAAAQLEARVSAIIDAPVRSITYRVFGDQDRGALPPEREAHAS